MKKKQRAVLKSENAKHPSMESLASTQKAVLKSKTAKKALMESLTSSQKIDAMQQRRDITPIKDDKP